MSALYVDSGEPTYVCSTWVCSASGPSGCLSGRESAETGDDDRRTGRVSKAFACIAIIEEIERIDKVICVAGKTRARLVDLIRKVYALTFNPFPTLFPR